MALELPRARTEQPVDGNVIIREHLYLTEDRNRVVREGDPAGRWLWASPGTEVSMREAIRLGAGKVEPEVQAPPAEPDGTAEEAETDTKAAKQAPNKARKPGTNNATTPAEDK